jgi:hypothetical protein
MNTGANASPKFELSPVQLIAGCLAAVTAAVLASFFGVAGTIIGTALGSIVGTAGTALYSHSIRRTQARLRRLREHENAQGSDEEPAPAAPHTGWRQYLRRNWVMIAVGAAAAFVIAMTAVTGVEAAARKQLWAIVTGHSQPAGPTTTLGGVVGGASAEPTPAVAPTAEPSVSSSPTLPISAPSPTARSTPESTPTPTPQVTPSTRATASP